MQLPGWIADQHVWATSFALAASILLTLPLVAAQRPGRGIKPWWIACRYLAWTGLIGSVFALISGEFLAKNMGLLGEEWILRNQWSDLRIHQYLGGAMVFFGCLCLRSAYIKRKEHQGIGLYVLLTGLLWATATLGAGHYGIKLSRLHKEGKIEVHAKNEASANDDQATNHQLVRNSRFTRILDYSSLVAMHSTEPVRSPAHNNRWIRVWVSQNASEAYASGGPLPSGSLVVMSSFEDRWGRPTYEIGPLYILEVLASGESRLGMYWSNVPESRRDEVGGVANVSWTEPDENLAGCLECHSDGMALHTNRSRIRIRRPTPEAAGAG